MREQEFKKVSYWIVFTDKNEYRLSNKELDMLMDAEGKGARLVRFDEFGLSIPYIKEFKHKHYSKHETEFDKIPDDERKYIVGTETRKLLA